MKKQKLTDSEKAFLIIAAAVIIMTALLTSQVVNDQQKKKQIKEQVEEYEKTLPASYLEQKARVTHYRDSLINVKLR